MEGLGSVCSKAELAHCSVRVIHTRSIAAPVVLGTCPQAVFPLAPLPGISPLGVQQAQERGKQGPGCRLEPLSGPKQ